MCVCVCVRARARAINPPSPSPTPGILGTFYSSSCLNSIISLWTTSDDGSGEHGDVDGDEDDTVDDDEIEYYNV